MLCQGCTLWEVSMTIHKLDKNDYQKVRPLFKGINHHMAIAAIINGEIPDAPVYVDNIDNPQTAVMLAGHRVFLAGNTENNDFNRAVADLFADEYYPQMLDAGKEAFTIYYAPDEWQQKGDVILQGKNPMTDTRSSLALKALNPDIETTLPDGYTLREVNQELVESNNVKKLDELLEEMTSERPSVDDFLEKSFGYALLHRDELAGWCLSEYNGAEQCEIGIAVFDEHQRQGLATKITAAFIEMAQTRGIKRIGWHAWKRNTASLGLAQKLGFEQDVEYSVLFAFFEETINLAVNGNVCLMREQYQEAIDWFEKAFAAGDAAAWAYFNAARAAAVLDKDDECFGYLNTAIDKGWDDIEHTQNCAEFESLHDTPNWEAALSRLQEK
jgi:RimJ/RimL family protein N-acetyltransferase